VLLLLLRLRRRLPVAHLALLALAAGRPRSQLSGALRV
jgi:hypothetical protein